MVYKNDKINVLTKAEDENREFYFRQEARSIRIHYPVSIAHKRAVRILLCVNVQSESSTGNHIHSESTAVSKQHTLVLVTP